MLKFSKNVFFRRH